MAFSEGQAWEDADLLWSGLDSIKAPVPEPIFAALRSTRNPRYFVLLNIFMFVCLGMERSTFYTSPPIIGDFPLPRSAMSPWRPRRALLSNFSVFTAFAANAVINVSAGAFLDPIKFSVGLEPAKVQLALGEKLAMFSAGPLGRRDGSRGLLHSALQYLGGKAGRHQPGARGALCQGARRRRGRTG